MNHKLGYRASVVGLFATAVVLGSLPACSKAGTETLTGTAKGRNGDVTVEVQYGDGKIQSVKVTEHKETAGLADPAIEKIPAEIVSANSVNVDAVSGATVTSKAIMKAVENALESGGVDTSGMAAAEEWKNQDVSYKAGTYTGEGKGYNGPIQLNVTFGKDKIEKVEVKADKETAHIGTPAYTYLIEDAVAANGAGIDTVSGATFTSLGFKEALQDAAKQASVSDADVFAKNTVKHEPEETINETYDVVVVGAGGAGMAVAVQAVQNGMTAAVLEENAEIGGNTVASGGQYQSVQDYLVWDAKDPDAVKGEYEGKQYDKVKMAAGNITVLKEILDWNEKPFDPSYFKDHEFTAGDVKTVSGAGVHEEYLDTLKALKKEIKAYLDWAQPKLDQGVAETELTLFSTLNLHIFQTYYGGLRPNADMTKWIYGDADLVKQFVEGGQDLKGWLEDQGAMFDNSKQPTIVGALWNRENDFLGCDLDGDGKADPDGKRKDGKTVWNTYFAPMEKTVMDSEGNAIMRRTRAESLIVEDGRVTGVNAVRYDGTKLVLKARKGVVMATGGYAADIQRVMDTNEYWQPGSITDHTETTNRSSLIGSGIDMGKDAGADVTGLGWAQMMPISWVDDGDLAFGGGDYSIYISPKNGERFVNETSERDVLSIAEFANGVTYKDTNGTFLEIANADAPVAGPYPYGTPKDEDRTLWESDVEGRQYTRTVDELDDLLKEFGFDCTEEEIRKTIEEYDHALMSGKEDEMKVTKTGWSRLIGSAEKDENGNYKPETYTLDGVKLKVRLLAPSTHHTMGGLKIDAQRHVLDKNGDPVKGLYAAGEVTGGIHGGNRLGGNAIVEILVSGRAAVDTIMEDA